ncbi:MAG: ribonuclease R [Pseudomonadota bacterium]
MTSHVLEDPNAEREAEKYDRPIASREMILEMLKQHGGPMTLNRLIATLEYDGDEERIEALRRRLRAMERDGQLIRNRRDGYVPLGKAELVRGRVQGHRDGFGFLIPDEGGEDVFLSARVMRALLHGDRAIVQITGVDRRGRREGALVEVLERANAEVVGRVVLEAGVAFVIPDNKRITQDILVPLDALNGAQDSQIVRLAIVEQPTLRNKPVGKVVEILGDHMAPGMEIDVSIHSHSIPCVWPEDVLAHIEGMSEEVAEADKLGRVDVRHLPLVTIDGEDARDFDDAVFCEPTAKGFRLLVAIADVSHYVRVGSPLDREAFLRGTSVYFPGRVVPMLPEILSNGLCSLNPHVDRLCLCCEMLISGEGKIIRSRFFEGVMRSHARLTYTEVARILLDGDAELRERHAALVPHITALHELYKVLLEERERRGAMDFDTTETKIIFGEGRKIDAIVPYERNDAHRLIEECMIAANVAAARYLERRKVPGLYRIHDTPTAEKLTDLRKFLAELGLSLGGGDKPAGEHYNALLREVRGRADAHLIQTVLLRSLKQAVYSPDNIGHFGLAHQNYAHFTSPIRRYPDLLVHRGIRHVLRTGDAERFPYSHDEMVIIGEHCSNNERRADEATRDATDWLKCEYMLDKVGDVFDGVITSVTSFGLFVELKDVFVEGLVHVTALDKDYYQFDPVGHRMVGERSGRVFRLGDTVSVQVVRVDLDDRKIDFSLADGGKPAAAPVGEGPSDGDDESMESAESATKRKRKRRKKKPREKTEGQDVSDASADEEMDADADDDDARGNRLTDAERAARDERDTEGEEGSGEEDGDEVGDEAGDDENAAPRKRRRRRRKPAARKPEQAADSAGE